MFTLNPYLSFKGNCKDAIEFYRQAMDAELLYSSTYGNSPMKGMAPDDAVMHCTLKTGNSFLMLCDDLRSEEEFGHSNVTLSIGLNDPERARQLFDRLSDGGEVSMPMQKTFWAEAFGMFTDRFGVNWMINCDVPDSEHAKHFS